jgi:23S rRNA (cytidine1920-2'-O)/16S rRNA (cytidine1409-2'-O)-methyltransferase
VRRRLDVEMVRRGVAGSRSEAALAIRSGKVRVAGRPALKAGTLIQPGEPITISEPARKFVSRGGEKLEAALDRFLIDVAGRRALDAGASTGGFTDCLLARGAAAVIAVDVGFGQLDWRLREDPRVITMERTNVRELRPEDLPFAPDFVAADLAFISLGLVIPTLAECATPEAEFVLLVKPQFEAGRDDVPSGGVVSDPAVWRRVLHAVESACASSGIVPVGVMASPLLGPAGNVEFLLHAQRAPGQDGAAVPEITDQPAHAIERAVQEGIRLAAARG